MEHVAIYSQESEFIPPINYKSNRDTPRKWLFSHLRRHKFLIFIGLLMQIINITAQSIVPGIIGDIVALFKAGLLTQELITEKSVFILIMLLSLAIVQFVRSSAFEIVGALLERDSRDELYSSLLGKSQTFHDKQQIGDIMSRVTLDVRQLALFMNPGVHLIFMAFTFGLVPIIFIGFINYQLLITPIIFFITFLFLTKRYNDRLTPRSLISRIALANISSRLNEVITGIPIVKGASREDKEQRIFDQNINNYYFAEASLGVARARYWPTLTFGFTLTISIYHGTLLLNQGVIDLSELIEFVLLFQLVYLAVILNSFAISAVSMGLAASDRIFEILIGASEIDLNIEGYSGKIKGNIEFRNVTFGYSPKFPVVKDVSLVIKPGQTVALIGMTGSGKTTLTKLLSRLYDPQKGHILIDGIELREWSIESLRKQFSLVEQDIFLFSRSISDNIRFGLQEIAEERVIEVAKIANAHEFIMSLPEGYNTIIGERGSTLSGGQRQRIAIARAIIRNPQILILDDASSAIDSKTEDEINRAIIKVLQGRVAFIITHRIAQIRRADVIVLLEDGRIIDQGNHEYMLKNSNKYREIFSVFDGGLK